MVEGNILRSTQRISGLDINTLMKILVKVGDKCEKIMGSLIVSVPVKEVQIDEIWAFVGKKQKALEDGDDPNFGDQYCFIALERHTKLVLNLI